MPDNTYAAIEYKAFEHAEKVYSLNCTDNDPPVLPPQTPLPPACLLQTQPTPTFVFQGASRRREHAK